MKLLQAAARRPRLVELGLFLFAVVVMGTFMALAPGSLRPAAGYNDYLSFYKPPAVHLLAGRGLTGIDGLPATHDPPGYPLVLAFVYGTADVLHVGREGLVNVATVAMLAVACVLVYRLGRAVFGFRVGVVAGLVWVTYPVEVLMAPYRFSEVPFSVVLYLTALVFVDGAVAGLPGWRRMAVVGALIGVSALIRPQAVLLVVPYAVALWALARHQRVHDRGVPASGDRSGWSVVGLCGVMVGSYLAAIAPWETWVRVRTGSVIALSTGGPSAILNGLTVGLHPIDERGHAYLPAGVIAVERRVAAHQSSLTGVGKIAQFMSHQLVAHPVAVVELVALKAASAFYGTNSLTHQLLIALVQLPYLVLMLAGLVLAWRSGRRSRWFAMFAVAVVGYMWLMTIAVLSIVRYMGPALGLMIPFAALALVRAWEWIRRGRATVTAPAPSLDRASSG